MLRPATRIGVVGAGILGAAIARELAGQVERAEVTVLEAEDGPARHQTGHNSGVAHAGVYYPPGSLKATLCREGITRLRDYCAERDLPFVACGKLIVARTSTEVQRLSEIERRARANGVPGLRRLDAVGLQELEPHVRGVAALHSPSTAIVDFPAVTRALLGDLRAAGGEVRYGFRVDSIVRAERTTRVRSVAGEELGFDALVVCAGLQSDRLARAAGEPPEPRIVPFRGEYHRLRPGRAHLIRGLVYPVPDPAFPFLGVHFTRRVDGTVDIGPNAVLALSRHGYRRSDVSLRDLNDTLRSPGLRRLAARHWRMGLREWRTSFSRRAFVAAAASFVPELRAGDVEPAPAGVRAQAIDPDGTLVDDFRITERAGLVLVRNAPSPAATSSLAIARHVGAIVGRSLAGR